MADLLLPVVLLAVVFVAFGLAHRNRRGSCAGCDGDCDRTRCSK